MVCVSVWTGQLSKIESKRRTDEWNAAVDAYVASGRDPRRLFDVELHAKIGLNGGPLYKHCEAQGCGNVEKRDVEKMKCCGSCKLVRSQLFRVGAAKLMRGLHSHQIVYCSQACQVSDWPRHKARCKTKSHREQQLKTQDALEQLMSMNTREAAGLDVGSILAGTLGRMSLGEEVD